METLRDQAAALRELVRRLQEEEQSRVTRASGGRVIVVVSGKGGVGKTALAVNLGVILARSRRVALFDADLGMANADIVLGAPPTSRIEELVTWGQAWSPPDLPFHLVGGGSGDLRLLNLGESELAALAGALGKLQAQVALTLVDAGAGLHRAVVAMMAAADEILLITTPEPSALADAYATLKAIARHNRPALVWTVCNRVQSSREAARVLERLGRVSRRFLNLSPSPLGFVLEDPEMHAAILQQHPVVELYPQAPSTRCLEAIARCLDAAGQGSVPSDLGALVGHVGRGRP
ncbi:MAG: P-loop NTPase [Bacillota bacterium]